jgi:hypothetical protein
MKDENKKIREASVQIQFYSIDEYVPPKNEKLILLINFKDGEYPFTEFGKFTDEGDVFVLYENEMTAIDADNVMMWAHFPEAPKNIPEEYYQMSEEDLNILRAIKSILY